jgi:micrococcal nuclease
MSCGDVTRAMPRGVVLAAAILAAFTAATCSAGDGRRVVGRVVRVIDGDTVIVHVVTMRPGLQKGEKVRLVAVGCPESGHDGGARATARLAELILGRTVILRIAFQSRDRHGRLLAGVYLADGKTLVQESLVREGLCETLVIPPNVEYVEQLRSAKIDAQRAGRGIWARTGGVTEGPSDHQRRHR